MIKKKIIRSKEMEFLTKLMVVIITVEERVDYSVVVMEGYLEVLVVPIMVLQIKQLVRKSVASLIHKGRIVDTE